MEEIADALKAFLLGKVNAELEGLSDGAAQCPALAEKDVLFGAVDLSRNESQALVSIWPESTSPETPHLDGYADMHRVAVTFLLQKDAYPVLVRRMFRYAKAFRLALEKSPDLGGAADSAAAVEAKWFPDTGAEGQRAAAVEITLNVVERQAFAVNPNTGI